MIVHSDFDISYDKVNKDTHCMLLHAHKESGKTHQLGNEKEGDINREI